MVKDAQPYLLEPIMDVEVVVPKEQMGDVLATSTAAAAACSAWRAGVRGTRTSRRCASREIFRYSNDCGR